MVSARVAKRYIVQSISWAWWRKFQSTPSHGGWPLCWGRGGAKEARTAGTIWLL